MITKKNSPLSPRLCQPDLEEAKLVDVMTALPITIDEEGNLSSARRIMRERKIRHLPVVYRGKLTGILSERDLRLVSLLPEISQLKVADIMTSHPLTFSAHTPVIDAISAMIAKKYGCLIIMGDGGDIAGIFTNHDALCLLAGERGLNLPAPTAYPPREDEDLAPEDETDYLE